MSSSPPPAHPTLPFLFLPCCWHFVFVQTPWSAFIPLGVVCVYVSVTSFPSSSSSAFKCVLPRPRDYCFPIIYRGVIDFTSYFFSLFICFSFLVWRWWWSSGGGKETDRQTDTPDWIYANFRAVLLFHGCWFGSSVLLSLEICVRFFRDEGERERKQETTAKTSLQNLEHSVWRVDSTFVSRSWRRRRWEMLSFLRVNWNARKRERERDQKSRSYWLPTWKHREQEKNPLFFSLSRSD